MKNVRQIDLPPDWTRDDSNALVTVLHNQQIESVITVTVIPVKTSQINSEAVIKALLQRAMPKATDFQLDRFAPDSLDFQAACGRFRVRGQARLKDGFICFICAEFPADHEEMFWPEITHIIQSIQLSP